MALSIQAAINDKIGKLRQLRDLLGDPEIEAIARQILSQKNGATRGEAPPATDRKPAAATMTPEPPRRRKKGGKDVMVREAMKIVTASEGPISVRDVTDLMEANGFVFKAKDKYVAISKALRRMADADRIKAHKSGPGKKAAILYTRREWPVA